MSIEDWAKKILFYFSKERVDITLKKITKNLGLSLSSLYKKWYFKTSPKKFLSLLRLALAMKLLSDNHNSRKVVDIADELKFCDHIYFCKWFKRLTGITPKRFQLKYGKYFNKGKLDRIKLKKININLIYLLSKILENYNSEKIDFSFLDSYLWGDRNPNNNKNNPQRSFNSKGRLQCLNIQKSFLSFLYF